MGNLVSVWLPNVFNYSDQLWSVELELSLEDVLSCSVNQISGTVYPQALDLSTLMLFHAKDFGN